MKKYKIYALHEINSNKYRYIGYTTNSLNHRLNQHIRRSKSGNEPNKYKANWINRCIKNNIKICVKLLDEFDTAEDMYNGEIYHIKQAKINGHTLTNMTDGGEKSGSPNDEVRKKIANKALGHKRNVGRKHAPSHGQKVRIAKLGIKRPDVTKRQLGENNKSAKLTSEQVIEIKQLLGIKSLKEIAGVYKVSSATICDIKSGRTWSHI